MGDSNTEHSNSEPIRNQNILKIGIMVQFWNCQNDRTNHLKTEPVLDNKRCRPIKFQPSKNRTIHQLNSFGPFVIRTFSEFKPPLYICCPKKSVIRSVYLYNFCKESFINDVMQILPFSEALCHAPMS